MRLVGFDVETRGVEVGFGLQPFRARTGEAWLTSCALATMATTTGRLSPTKEWLRRWLQAMASTGTRIVGWNAPFDMAWLIALGLRDEVFACEWLDAMLLWRHLTASPEWSGIAPKSYGLKSAVREILPMCAGYETEVNFDTDTQEGLSKLLEYNKLDARHTLNLALMFIAKLTPQQLNNALIEAACLPLVAEAHVEGLVANRDAAEKLAQKLEKTCDLAMVKLAFECGGAIKPEVLASPTKLRKLLYQDWGLPVQKLTDKGAPSTDRDVLTQLAPLDKRAGLLNEYREAKNNRTKFAVGLAQSLDYNGDGRVRPNARVYSTYTGRMTYSSKILKNKDERPTGVPLHQWKNDPEFRDPIEAPEGYTLLEFDFAGQEFRWMAVMSGDYTMLKLCAPGEDAHSFMGAKIGHKDYDWLRRAVHQPSDLEYALAKKLRKLGKVGNLSLQYRTSAPALQRVARTNHGLILSDPESVAIHGTYRMTYPGVQVYWKHQIAKARLTGWIETIAGRRVQVGPGDSWKRLAVREVKGEVREEFVDNKWAAESTAINFPIQGSGADQKYAALKLLKDYLPSVDGRFYFELHDGIFVVVPDRHADRAAHEVKHLLSNIDYKKLWGVDLPIQFPVDAKLGKTWGQLKEIVG